MKNTPSSRGYTLIELVVAVGLFALVMTLATGAYILMIDLNRQAQATATGINSLSFALESMTRSIRTGAAYNCGAFGGDCPSGGSEFSFRDASGTGITYSYGHQADGSTGAIVKNGSIILTDPSVAVSDLRFYVSGTGSASSGDVVQPHVTIVISGTVSSGPRKTPQSFTVETGATMRGIDLNVTSAPVESPPTPRCTLVADSGSTVAIGGKPTLSWTTENAISFSISPGFDPSGRPATGGTAQSDESQSSEVTYTGTANNSEGSGTCQVTVTVTP